MIWNILLVVVGMGGGQLQIYSVIICKGLGNVRTKKKNIMKSLDNAEQHTAYPRTHKTTTGLKTCCLHMRHWLIPSTWSRRAGNKAHFLELWSTWSTQTFLVVRVIPYNGLVLDFVTKVPYCKHLCLTSLYKKLSIKNLLVFQISLCAGEQGR